MAVPPDRLPVKADFVSHDGDLDQTVAWDHFGGLTLDEAKMRFADNALYYQEDFMFMGTDAFRFYFSVLDAYLRNAPDEESDDDHESWIIAQCIRAQFESDTVGRLRPIIPAIVDLAEFVRNNIRRFGYDDAERHSVATAWADLIRHIKATGNS